MTTTDREAEVDSALAKALLMFGDRLMNDPELARAALLDLTGGRARRNVALLVAAVEAKVPREIRSLAGALTAGAIREKLSQRLADNVGCSGESAQWTVDVWQRAIGAGGGAGGKVAGNRDVRDRTAVQTTPAAQRVPPGSPGPRPDRLVTDAGSAKRWRPRLAVIAAAVAVVVAVAGFALAPIVRRDWAQSAYDAAVAASNRGDTTAALASFRHARDLEPDFFDAWLGEAELLVKKRQFEPDARRALDQAVRLRPRDEAAWFYAGYVQGELDHYAQAVTDDKNAVSIDPQDYSAWGNLSYAYYYNKQYAQALDAGNKAVSGHNLLGSIYVCERLIYHLRQYGKTAETACTQAVSASPNSADAANALGWAILNADDADRYGDALSAFQSAMKLATGDAWADPWWGAGTVHVMRKEYGLAVPVLKEAVKRDHSNAKIWFQLGVAQYHSNDRQAARASFYSCLGIDSNDRNCRNYVNQIENDNDFLKMLRSLSSGGR